MVYVNDNAVEYHEGMTVASLVEMLRGIEVFKKYFIYDTYSVIIDGQFINRGDYDSTTVEDGTALTLRGLSTGG